MLKTLFWTVELGREDAERKSPGWPLTFCEAGEQQQQHSLPFPLQPLMQLPCSKEPRFPTAPAALSRSKQTHKTASEHWQHTSA